MHQTLESHESGIEISVSVSGREPHGRVWIEERPMDARRRPFARGLQGQATVSQKTGRRPEMSGLKRSRDKFRRFDLAQ